MPEQAWTVQLILCGYRTDGLMLCILHFYDSIMLEAQRENSTTNMGNGVLKVVKFLNANAANEQMTRIIMGGPI